ncbi:MAG: RNA polymerase sigma factor, partial [Trebonia sp.]
LAEQDRTRWNRALITEGTGLIADTLATTSAIGPYQLQAAIAAVHVEAASVADTDWAEILALYELLARVSPGPLVSLGKAVAVAMVHGPAAGLAATDELAGALARHHRFHAVRGHLLDMSGDQAAAAAAYDVAARYATNTAEKRYLDRQSRRVGGH